MKRFGVALNVLAQAAGLPLKRRVSYPGLVPDALSVLTHAFILVGFCSPFSGIGRTRNLLHRGASPRCSREEWTQPELFCSRKMPLWASAHAHQPSYTVSTPNPTQHPQPRGCWTWCLGILLWVGWPCCYQLMLFSLIYFTLFLNVPCSFTTGKVQSLLRLLLYYSQWLGRQCTWSWLTISAMNVALQLVSRNISVTC